MENWKSLQSKENLEQIISDSQHSPQIIFKHSTRCNISSFIKNRLEKQSLAGISDYPIHYLDLIQHREISNLIAERFTITHESPQLLVISKGRCIYHSSHLDVSIEHLEEIVPIEKS
ncbi:bacillithiol system redox-active protein YtxJ [Membranihabitans maritimus]|uniref:bacillithiol system redox-active protein YtxJ n=1 Tax=Membranihabitans maritimus TaxID=2904244 RepID=UPI001EFF6AC4|nr:bacillithiol system redox-active protein YtxJ [Membranihabitans maritimus]